MRRRCARDSRRLAVSVDGARPDAAHSGEGFVPFAEAPIRNPERGGFGLLLVDRVARRWGVRHEEHSTVVWSELAA